MPFPKNVAFSLLIKIKGRLHEFNFRQRGVSQYDTDTTDDRGNRIFFKIERENESWKIMDASLPAWLTENENLIVDATRDDSLIRF
jgi:hypothetical protein